jgi:plastocyanin
MKGLHGWSRIVLVALVALGVATLSLGLSLRAASAQDSAVSIVDFAFEPPAVSVTAGSTVTWTNSGAAPHTATSDSGAFDSGTLQPGASFSQTFDTPGTFGYLCTIHPSMTGTVTVTEAAAAAPAATAEPTAAAAAAAEPTAAAAAGAAQPVTQVPSTGVGVAPGVNAALVALVLFGAAALGIAARVAYRRG